MNNTELLFISIGILIGITIGYIMTRYLEKKNVFSKLTHAKKEVSTIIKSAKIEADRIKNNKIFQAKEKFLELKAEHKKNILAREQHFNETKKHFKAKENELNNKLEEVKHIKTDTENHLNDIHIKANILKEKEIALNNKREEVIKQLEKISTLSIEEAKKQLISALEAEAKSESFILTQNILAEAKLTAEKNAKKIVIETIQRVGVEEAIENCVTTFHLDSDEIKGKIIGREGRNIRAFEAATGVEIIVDDTPGAIILSCFDSIRREIARLSLHKLVVDGRIHPARIEEVVNKTSKQIHEEIITVGKQTIIELGIGSLHPELIRIVGRMKYRSSYGQNLLQHSKEVANLCAIMASELGLNPKIAKRAGLLHDIGKVAEQENETPHALLGMQWAEKYGEKPTVLNAIGAHHDEIEMTNLTSPIVQVCDAISGSRPGIRRQITESYIQRLKDLERIALQENGVKKAYAIQAGRELRVIVDSENIDDTKSNELSYLISKNIESELTYPGQVKVTVIRETRSVNIAK